MAEPPLKLPALTLVVVTHNSARWLPGLFQSWRKAVPSLATEIVVADAGSTDNTRDLAAAQEPSAQILACGNIGYGAAINRAAAATSAPWLLLCNPDLSFPNNFAGTFLLPMMNAPPLGSACIAPGLVNEDATGQPSVGPFPSIRRLITDQFRSPLNRKFTLPQPTGFYDWATGACLLVRREHFKTVSGFDEKFFLYVEEVDLQRRLANIGLRTWFIQDVGLIHLAPNAASPRHSAQQYSTRGLLRYFAKHGTPIQLLAYRLLCLASFRLSVANAFASRRKILETPTGP